MFVSFTVSMLRVSPIIGCIPSFDITSENSRAPHILLVSVSARAGIPILRDSWAVSSIFKAPSSNEYGDLDLR